MLGLLPCGLLPVQADLGIALTVGNAGHGQIHTDLAALAVEVITQALQDLGVAALRNTDYMLGGPGHFALYLFELGGGRLADGAEFGGRVALMDITADSANIFSHSENLLFSNDYRFCNFIIARI